MPREDFYEFLLEYGKGLEVLKEGEVIEFATYEPLPGIEPVEVKGIRVKTHKESFKPLRIGDFLVIPPWIKPIFINPGGAFGTGLHPTTQLCLSALEEFFQPGWSAIDVGCGSGILSIALKRLVASEVLAIDKDPVAVQECAENAKANRVELKVLCATPEEVELCFDFLVANLDIGVFRSSMPKLFELYKKMGVFSGIYRRKELGEFMEMIRGYPLEVKSVKSKGGWFVVVVQRTDIL